MGLVVDDHLLLDLLAGAARGWLAEETAQSAVGTTGRGYYRGASAADYDRHGIARRADQRPAGRRSASGPVRIASLPDIIGLSGRGRSSGHGRSPCATAQLAPFPHFDPAWTQPR